MRDTCSGRMVLVVTLALSLAFTAELAWAQGAAGRRSAPTQQAGATGRGGGRGGAGASATDSFYNFDTRASSGMQIPDAPPVETHQKISVNGESLAYTARAGYVPLRNATTGQAAAHLFFTYYSKDAAGNASSRPLVFFLGGAPGVSAAWQDLGGLGPKRMKWAADGTAGRPPYAWADNQHTLLPQADLVFVNPVGTAFSRPDQPGHAQEFWTTGTDVASLAEFVRSFTGMYGRRDSPLFIAAEDAETGRAAGVGAYLIEHQVPVSGVILLSMKPAADAIAGDEQFITLLPSMVLAAWHHKKLAPELQALGAEQIAERARQFASREYLHALYKGERMTAEERTSVVNKLSQLTGLSKAFIVSNDLRIPLERFRTEMFSADRMALSVSDARTTGYVPASGGGRRGFGGGGPAATLDYNDANLAAGMQIAYEDYLGRELGFKSGAGIFYLSSGGVGTFTSTGSDDGPLANAFARDPRLRLFVAASFFDLGTPFYATEFTVAHLGVSPAVAAHNVTLGHFEAGQMAYVDSRALARLQAELARFISGADTRKTATQGAAREPSPARR